MSAISRVDPDAFVESDPFEQGWIIGFLEGEGSFTLQRKRKVGLAYPRISASQKSAEPLETAQRILGGKVYFSRHHAAQARRSGVDGFYVWCIDGKGVADLMLTLRPHLSSRRQEQIDACVAGEVRRPARGEGNVTTHLTNADVALIRASPETQVVLAKRYGLHPSSISNIRRRVTWAHV